jgi:peptidoglycan/LPS O-acetylase OafA/YrhL
MRFRPDVEGLRAVAILPVVLYHASQGLAPGGFVGVDIFFVISGYLIAGIIAGELDGGHFSLGSFYERRVRRIFPALFFMLAGSCVLAYWILPPLALKEFGATVVSTVLFSSNVEFLHLSGYFDGSGDLKPLLHTWSLAVEEQFYIVFPLLMIAIWRWFRPRAALVLGLAALLALAKSLWVFQKAPSAAFYLTPNRAIELLIGALLAVSAIPRLTARVWREVLTGIGMLLIMACVVGYDSATAFPGWHALVPCIGAACIIYGGRDGESTVCRVLSLAPVRYIGAISYALYLWHWPLLVFVRHYTFGEMSVGMVALTVAAAFALAAFSGRYIERPFRQSTRGATSRRPVFLAAAACAVVFGAAGAAAVADGGVPQRYSPAALAMFRYSTGFNHRRPECHGEDGRSVPYANSCVYGAVGAVPSIAVWGDSYGAELVVGLGELARRQGGAVLQLTSSACPPAVHYSPLIRPGCSAHNDELLVHLLADQRIDEVVLVANYEEYVQDHWPVLSAGLDAAVAALLRAGKDVTLLYPFPTFHYPVPDALGELVTRGRAPTLLTVTRAEYLRVNALPLAALNALAARYPVRRIDPTERLCNLGRCVAYDGTDALYWDAYHVSVDGGRRVAAEFSDAMRAGITRPKLPD